MGHLRKTVAGLVLALPVAMLPLPQSASAQSVAPPDGSGSALARQQPAPAARSAAQAEAGYVALGAEMLRLNERLAALERFVSQLLARQEEDQRRLASLTDELGRFRSDIEARMAEAPASLPVAVAEAAPAEQRPSAVPAPAIDRFEQAIGFARKEDWPSAELAFSTFIANNPDEPRLAEARYQLGLAYLGQGQAGQAAGIFLDLFESGAAAAFGAENLFALARALRALENADQAQVCSVYSEIEVSYGSQLSPARRGELLDLRLAGGCQP